MSCHGGAVRPEFGKAYNFTFDIAPDIAPGQKKLTVTAPLLVTASKGAERPRSVPDGGIRG